MYSRIGGKRMYLATKEKVKPADWLVKEGRVRADKRVPRHTVINRNLSQLRNVFALAIKDIEDEGREVTADAVKELMEIKLQRKDAPEIVGNMDMWSYFDAFIKNMTNERGKDPARYFSNARDVLKKFNPKLAWKDINKKTYRNFVEYMEGKSYSKNYIGTIANRVRNMCNRAWEDDIQKGSNHKAWTRIEETVPATYLSIEEIETLYNLDIEKKHLREARDVFVIGCWTGMRSNKYLTIDPEKDISPDGNKLIILPGKGYNEPIQIPLHWMVKEILEKYNYDLPKFDQQKLNSYIKDVAEAAGFTESFKKTRTHGGSVKEMTMKRFKAIITHTARRSFATNHYKLGVPARVIMHITGHMKLDTFMRYVRIDQAESANYIANLPIYQKKIEQESN